MVTGVEIYYTEYTAPLIKKYNLNIIFYSSFILFNNCQNIIQCSDKVKHSFILYVNKITFQNNIDAERIEKKIKNIYFTNQHNII